MNVRAKLMANIVTAESSRIAEYGSHVHAAATISWYARTSPLTRSAQPTVSKSSPANMSLLLNSKRIPEKAGSTRCPTQKTIMATKPTVSAWREAPQMPDEFVALAAHTPSSAAIISHTYAERTNIGDR